MSPSRECLLRWRLEKSFLFYSLSLFYVKLYNMLIYIYIINIVILFMLEYDFACMLIGLFGKLGKGEALGTVFVCLFISRRHNFSTKWIILLTWVTTHIRKIYNMLLCRSDVVIAFLFQKNKIKH